MRVKALQHKLAERGEAAALITSPENIRYLTGFFTWNAHVPFALAIVPARGEPVLLVPRADDLLAHAVARCSLEPYDPGTAGFRTTAEACRRVLERADIREGGLAIEFGALSFDRVRVLQDALSRHRFADGTDALADLRMIKDSQEQEWLRQAAELAASAMAQTVSRVRPGVSELEVKATMDFAAHTVGARRWPTAVVQCQTNVVSGPKLNRLHDAATGRTVGPGEVLFILSDLSVHGYRANIGRTLFVPGGTPPDDARRTLEFATTAQRAAIRHLHPGNPLREAVQAADDVLAEAGLAGRRTYPIVRGLGLRTDERPKAADATDLDRPLEYGMCMCVQLYIRQPDRIVGRSDTVLVTEKGAEVISEPPGEP